MEETLWGAIPCDHLKWFRLVRSAQLTTSATYSLVTGRRDRGILACMYISDESARCFQQLWKEDYGEDITLDQAKEIGGRLVYLYIQLLKPLPRIEKERHQDPLSP